MIRTGGDRAKPVQKGWVREGILSALSKDPMTLTELSKSLGVSKSTASYHLDELARRGIVENAGSQVGRGGVSMVRYTLREGSVVLFPGTQEEEAELRRMRETFDLETMVWEGKKVALAEVETLLYKLFLRMFKVTRSGHRALMLSYGERAGALLGPRVEATSSRQSLLGVAKFLSNTEISRLDVIEVPGSPVLLMVSSNCIGSDFHVGNSCHFLEGMVTGMAKSKLGGGVLVRRVEVPGPSTCNFAVGRVKSIDASWLADTILSSPSFSAINRGREKA